MAVTRFLPDPGRSFGRDYQLEECKARSARTNPPVIFTFEMLVVVQIGTVLAKRQVQVGKN